MAFKPVDTEIEYFRKNETRRLQNSENLVGFNELSCSVSNDRIVEMEIILTELAIKDGPQSSLHPVPPSIIEFPCEAPPPLCPERKGGTSSLADFCQQLAFNPQQVPLTPYDRYAYDTSSPPSDDPSRNISESCIHCKQSDAPNP
jgi:hypothetical protein